MAILRKRQKLGKRARLRRAQSGGDSVVSGDRSPNTKLEAKNQAAEQKIPSTTTRNSHITTTATNPTTTTIKSPSLYDAKNLKELRVALRKVQEAEARKVQEAEARKAAADALAREGAKTKKPFSLFNDDDSDESESDSDSE
ncbi:hypothetical protein PV11_09799, partial [Exophiala sideris]